MAIQLSPGVSVTEVDLTTVVPSVSTSTGAFVGNFEWGPASVRVTVDSENTLASVFGTPNSNTYTSFFTAASFLAYSNDLRVVRAISTDTRTATANSSASVQIANEDVYETEYLQGSNANAYGAFASRYAGAAGNAIQVNVYDNASAATLNTTLNLSGGITAALTDGDINVGYDLFTNSDVVDISLVLTGGASVTVQQYVIDNVVTPAGSVTGRSGDSVAFISPRYSDVVNQSGGETDNIKNWLETLARSSSYTVTDSGWKYMYDKYNGVYRYVPLNGDIAGLCAFTDQVRDPWFSPAGFNRGAIKNAVKLSWNPNQTQRDILYPLGVNPVVTFPGQGTVLYGDKTLQSKPSAFDRINVRRLFITLEKAISRAAKFSLFEFNDDFTRAQFVALVAPFLRDVQGRRGIYDFRVVCDTTNNTPQVIDNNQFVGDIYIKPARSINFIRLNFIAVGTGVQFTEVTGAI